MMDIQTRNDVFVVNKFYIQQCQKLTVLQDDWIPKIGDRVQRTYTIMEGEELQASEKSIEILTYKSDAGGWYHAIGGENSEPRLFDSTDDLYKKTCIYIPTFDDISSRSSGLEHIYFRRLSDLAVHTSKILPLVSYALMDFANREYSLLWDLEDKQWRKSQS